MAIFSMALPVPTISIRHVSDPDHEECKHQYGECALCIRKNVPSSNRDHSRCTLRVTLWSNQTEHGSEFTAPEGVGRSVPLASTLEVGCSNFSSAGIGSSVVDALSDFGGLVESDTSGCFSPSIPISECNKVLRLYCPVTCKNIRSLLPEAYILHQGQRLAEHYPITNLIITPREMYTIQVSLFDLQVAHLKGLPSVPLWMNVPLQLCTLISSGQGEGEMSLQWGASPSIQELLMLPLSSPFWASPVVFKQCNMLGEQVQTQFVLARLNISEGSECPLSRSREQPETRLLLMAPLSDPQAGTTATLKCGAAEKSEFELCIHLENYEEIENTGGRAKALLCIEAPEGATVEKVLQSNLSKFLRLRTTFSMLAQVT